MRWVPVLALIAMLWAPPAAAIDLFNLKNSLIQFALEQISTEDFTVTAEDVESPGDGVTELVGVAIADREGVWFRAERMGLQWNASRILRAELEINRLSAEGVEVLRAPKGEVAVEEDAAIAETDDDPFDWPRAPIATRIEEMRLDRVFIAEGVIAEQSISFDATGAARDEGDVQAVRLDVTRTDAVAGRIALDYERNFASDRLRMNLTAEEAAGGLVTALAGLPNDAASRVRIEADGPLTAWSLDFDARTERVFEATGSARLDLEGPLAVAAGFRLVPGPAMAPDLAALIGRAAQLDIDVAENDNGVVEIRRGRFDSPALTLAARGSVVRATGAADLEVTLAGDAALSSLAEGVAFERFGFDGTVRGTPEDMTATGALSLAGLATAPADIGSARLDTVVRIAGERIGFDIAGQVRGLRLDRIAPETVGPADLVARGVYEGETLTLSGLTLDSGLLTARASGDVALAEGRLGLDYALAADRLAPIAAAYDADAGGAFEVSGRVSGPLDAPRISGRAALADMVVEGEPYGSVTLIHDVTAGEIVRGTADLTAAGSPIGAVEAGAGFELANGVLDLHEIEAQALGATLAGAIRYRLDPGLAAGEITLDAPDLAPLSRLAGAPATGRLSGRVALDAAGGRQAADLDLTARGVDAFGARLARLDLTGRLTDALGTPALDARLEAEGAGYDKARIARIEGTVSATDLAVAPAVDLDIVLSEAAGFDARARRVSLNATIADAARLGEVTARLSAEGLAYQDVTLARLSADLSAEDALSALPEATLAARAERIGGPLNAASATIDARLRPEDGKARAEAELALAPVSAGGATVEGARLAATAEDALGADPRLDAQLNTGAVSAGGVRLDTVAATAQGLISALDLTVSTEGSADARPVSLATAARLDARAAEPVLRVTRLDAGFGGEAVSLNAPFTVTAGTATAIRGLDLALPQGRLSGDATLYPAGIAGEIELRLGDLGLLERLADAPLTAGTLDLTARIDTRPGRAGGAARLAARDLGIEGVAIEDGALALEAATDWDGRSATTTAAVTGPFGAPLRLGAGLPLRPGLGPLPSVPQDGALSGAVTWSGDVGEIWALVPGADHVLDGALDVDLALSGTVAEPEIGGSLGLAEGRYENLETGTILTRLTVTSAIAPSGDLTLSATARDGAKGRIEADLALAGERLSATLKTREAVLVRRDDVKAALGLDIRAEGPLAGPDISGRVQITRAEIRLVDASPPSVVTLGDVRIKGTPEPEPEPPAGEAIGLDLTISAARNIFVRGRGLDSEWQANLAVAGTAARPRVTGRVEKLRGRLNFIGTRFDLETGLIRFTGGLPVDPEVTVRLETEKNGITGGIAVTGRASDPEIGFFSQPALPEDEVLPRLLYGESSQSLSAGQAIQLASGIATLLDGSGGVVDKLRGTVGLDVLSVDPTGDSATVTVGKNIAEDVFVGAEQALDTGETRVTVEVEVFPSVTVDAETGAESGSSVGVNWSTDF